MQAASLEEDDDLQDIWTTLLINAVNSDSGINLIPAYIDILKALNPLEAKILQRIYSVKLDDGLNDCIVTVNLPDNAHQGFSLTNDASDPHKEITENVKLSLANLARLGCIGLETTWSGKQDYQKAYQNILGKKLIEACTLVVNT